MNDLINLGFQPSRVVSPITTITIPNSGSAYYASSGFNLPSSLKGKYLYAIKIGSGITTFPSVVQPLPYSLIGTYREGATDIRMLGDFNINNEFWFYEPQLIGSTTPSIRCTAMLRAFVTGSFSLAVKFEVEILYSDQLVFPRFSGYVK